MKIAVGSDHAGLELKENIMELLKGMGHEPLDFGTDTCQSVDYPDYGEKVAAAVSKGEIGRGILVCGTGIGMSIVANKFPNVRAALCGELFSARMSRLHNDSNILVLGGRVTGRDLAREIVKVWVETPFENGRHSDRLKKIALIEKNIADKKI